MALRPAETINSHLSRSGKHVSPENRLVRSYGQILSGAELPEELQAWTGCSGPPFKLTVYPLVISASVIQPPHHVLVVSSTMLGVTNIDIWETHWVYYTRASYWKLTAN
jgi:hypothetical protein